MWNVNDGDKCDHLNKGEDYMKVKVVEKKDGREDAREWRTDGRK
jgi:hypothetical protein